MLSDSEINDFIIEQKPKNTIKKTKSDIGVFKRWLALAMPSENNELEEISPCQLNSYLRSFYLLFCYSDNTYRYRIKRSFNIVLYNTDIYLDSYTAWKVILDSPSGSSNMTFQAVYSSKYISVLYRTMLNNL